MKDDIFYMEIPIKISKLIDKLGGITVYRDALLRLNNMMEPMYSDVHEYKENHILMAIRLKRYFKDNVYLLHNNGEFEKM